MPDLDTLFAAYDAELYDVSYRIRDSRMEATFRLEMQDARFDEALHDRILEACDGYEDADWHIETLDTDRSDTWAMCIMRIEARSLSSCRLLAPRVVATLPNL